VLVCNDVFLALCYLHQNSPNHGVKAVMYSQNEIPAIGAFITDGEDKYLLMSSKACC
jgi:hypothetical protein